MLSYKKLFINTYNKNKWNLIISILLSICVVLIEMITPYISMNIIDKGFQLSNTSIVVKLAILSAILYLIKALFLVITTIVCSNITNFFLRELNTKVINAILNKKHQFYLSNSKGLIIERIQEIWGLEDCVSPDLIRLLLSFFSSFTSVIILFSYSIKITIGILCFIPIIIFATNICSRMLKKYSMRVFESTAKCSGINGEILEGIDEIKNLALENYFRDKASNMTENKLISTKTMQVLLSKNTELISYLVSFMNLMIMLFSGIEITNGKMTIGIYVLIISYSSKILTPVVSLSTMIAQVQPLLVLMERIKSLINDENHMIEVEKLPNFNKNITCLNIYNLSFAYPNEINNIYTNFSYGFDKGTITMLKGRNGIGKSTLFKLITGQYDDYQGKILINNEDIRSYNSSRIMIQIMQRPYIFNMSLKDNIVLNQKYDPDKYNSVIKKLEMQRMFDRDMLYNDEEISEDGDSLSGGQIKIIAFARALYGDYKIILLDEVSSNMDKISADIIKDTLKVWKEDKIIIMIDHTEYYDEIADNVLLLN